jgi:hypothetical protein
VRRIISRIIVACVFIGAVVSVAESMPNASLYVTAQQREDGNLGSAYHLFHLSCWQGACTLTTLTIGQCSTESDRHGRKAPSAFPVAERESTRDGTLRVSHHDNTFVATLDSSDIGGAYKMVLRFTHDEPLPATQYARMVTGFSGGFVKDSWVLQRTLVVEYVPLPELTQVVKLQCDVVLPGVGRALKSVKRWR